MYLGITRPEHLVRIDVEDSNGLYGGFEATRGHPSFGVMGPFGVSGNAEGVSHEWHLGKRLFGCSVPHVSHGVRIGNDP